MSEYTQFDACKFIVETPWDETPGEEMLEFTIYNNPELSMYKVAIESNPRYLKDKATPQYIRFTKAQWEQMVYLVKEHG